MKFMKRERTKTNNKMNHGASTDHLEINDYLFKRNMKKEDNDILLRLLQRHKELGISEQIDYQKFYL